MSERESLLAMQSFHRTISTTGCTNTYIVQWLGVCIEPSKLLKKGYADQIGRNLVLPSGHDPAYRWLHHILLLLTPLPTLPLTLSRTQLSIRTHHVSLGSPLLKIARHSRVVLTTLAIYSIRYHFLKLQQVYIYTIGIDRVSRAWG